MDRKPIPSPVLLHSHSDMPVWIRLWFCMVMGTSWMAAPQRNLPPRDPIDGAKSGGFRQHVVYVYHRRGLSQHALRP